MGKQPPDNRFEDIQEALDRISCSLASISGTLDNFYVEIMKEKKEEERLNNLASNQPPFDHESK